MLVLLCFWSPYQNFWLRHCSQNIYFTLPHRSVCRGGARDVCTPPWLCNPLSSFCPRPQSCTLLQIIIRKIRFPFVINIIIYYLIRGFSPLDVTPNSQTNQRLPEKPAELGSAPLTCDPAPFRILHTSLNIMYLPTYGRSALKMVKTFSSQDLKIVPQSSVLFVCWNFWIVAHAHIPFHIHSVLILH